MTRNELFTKINQRCSELDDECNINWGGCCYVAAILAELLETANIPFKVIHYNKCGCHYAIKVSDRYLNRGHYKYWEIGEILEVSSDYLYDVYDDGDWNDHYDSEEYNDYVYDELKQIFEEYEIHKQKR